MSLGPENTLDPLTPELAPTHSELEQLQSILNSLRPWAYNRLRRQRIDSLKAFLSLSEEEVLSWSSCGTKIAAQVLAAQSSIRALLARLQQTGEPPWMDEVFVQAFGTENEVRAETAIDADAPFTSIMAWLSSRCTTERRLNSFLLRNGMLGNPPIILREIGEALGLSRQRVWELNLKVEGQLHKEQAAFAPLVERAIELVQDNGGSMELSQLTSLLLVRGQQGEMLRHATPFIELISRQHPWRNAGLVLNKDRVSLRRSGTRAGNRRHIPE